MVVEKQVSLQAHNTFGIVAKAHELVRIASQEDLQAVLADAQLRSKPKFVLGGGSNIVLTGDVKALVLKVEIKGRRLLTQTPRAWLVEVTIATGRPHQIRIHTAAAGAPLLGDPLYAPGGLASEQALPGDGGYQLHAHRLQLPLPAAELLELEAPLPESLRGAADG